MEILLSQDLPICMATVTMASESDEFQTHRSPLPSPVLCWACDVSTHFVRVSMNFNRASGTSGICEVNTMHRCWFIEWRTRRVNGILYVFLYHTWIIHLISFLHLLIKLFLHSLYLILIRWLIDWLYQSIIHSFIIHSRLHDRYFIMWQLHPTSIQQKVEWLTTSSLQPIRKLTA